MQISKFIFFAAALCLLSACNMDKMAAKMVPAHILEKNEAVIENVLAANAEYFTEFGEEDMEKAKVFFEENTSKGKVLRQDFVGINTSTSLSTGEGKSKNIDLSVEVQTEEGFTVISTQYVLDKDGNCCALANVNAQKFESSPIRVGLEMTMKALKTVGIILLIGVLGLVVFLMRRSKRKKAQASTST